MAGRIENGSSEDSPDIFRNPVKIETNAFKCDAIAMYKLNGVAVLDAVTTPGPEQLAKMLTIFKQAVGLIDPIKADYIDILNFNEIVEVVAQWVEKSTPTDSSGVGSGGFL